MSNKHELVPILRFSKFSGNWNVIRIEDVLSEIDAGWSPLCKEEQANDGEWGVLKTTAVTWNGFNGSENKKLPSTLKPRPHLEVVHGDILITRAGPIERVGVIAYVNQPRHKLMLSDKLIRITISKNHSSRFISIALGCNQTQRQLLKVKSGLAKAQANISQSIIKSLTLALPVKLEQQKIANFLTSSDTKIQELKRKHTLMQRYKKGVMQQLFSQSVRFKDDDGQDYPEWDNEPLGSVFCEVKDRVGCRDIDTYSITASAGFVSQKKKFGRDISGEQNSKYIALKNGQFSYNKGNSKSYRYGCVYQNRENKTIGVPNVFISFDLRDKEMSRDFFEHLFVNHYLDRHLRKLISSSARMDGLLNVNKTYFFEIPIPIPSSDEQHKIGLFLTQLDKKIGQLKTQLIQAETFKKGLLQQMFV